MNAFYNSDFFAFTFAFSSSSLIILPFIWLFSYDTPQTRRRLGVATWIVVVVYIITVILAIIGKSCVQAQCRLI